MRTHDRVSAAVVAARLIGSAQVRARGGAAGVRELADLGPAVVGAAAAAALTKALTELWERGWTPADVAAAVPRHLADLALDAVAADTARHPAAHLHPRWAAESRAAAEVWWRRGEPHLPQWAERAGLSLADALDRLVDVLAEFAGLPALPALLPPPGRPGPLAEGGVDARVLARVRALLAKAESTAYPQEAEALSAKAQELMARHAFEEAAMDARPQRAAASRIWLTRPYVTAKAQLVDAVAEANRCRSVFYPRLGCVVLVGHETDLEIVAVLSASLGVQATRALSTAPGRTRAYRNAFLAGYAHRIRTRLDLATATATDARALPVLARRHQVVEETYAALFPGVRTRRSAVSSPTGWGAGQAAADHADLLPARPRVAG
ncbi:MULTISPECIES: DUF2786 domain-containing protein [Actinokineospora]|uniref:DUF2786 domain-containing protein n=1 Tax=Actinokineospora TaxID=39845 RepID=UPI0016705E66|nr:MULTISPECIES: DUF2786 domain-containing protein [Actinokineospora]